MRASGSEQSDTGLLAPDPPERAGRLACTARRGYNGGRGRLRRLGIDPGTKRVGVAVADDDGPFASPRDTIDHVSNEATARAVAAIAKDEGALEIVVGFPLGLDGREGPSSRHARALAKAIARESGLRVVLWDERMTSQAAHRALASGGASSRDRRGKVDRIAAALLLESYVEAQRARAARKARSRAARSEASPAEGDAPAEEPWPRGEAQGEDDADRGPDDPPSRG